MAIVKGCIFDLDGVIVDTAKYHYLGWKRLADELGVPFSETDNEALKGVSRRDSLEKILEWGKLTLEEERKLELMEQKNEWYLEAVSGMNDSEILPGVADFMREVKNQGYGIALGSSSKNARRILGLIGMEQDFEVIIDGTCFSKSKPDPEVFLLGAEGLGLQPEECVVFEDSTAGIKGAKAGGMYCIGIGDAEVLSEADFVIPGFVGMDTSRLNFN